MMEKLLPCPFCGGAAERVNNGPTKAEIQTALSWGQDADDGGSFIRCTRCDAATALYFDRRENLYTAWNDRVPTCGYSCNGVNVSGDKASIDAVYEAFHSHGQIDNLKRNLRHWREECGKLHARLAILEQDGLTAKYQELFQAVAGYRDYLERSVNVGPLTNNPSKEARLLRRLWDLTAGVAEQSGAGAPETSVRCGAPAANPAR